MKLISETRLLNHPWKIGCFNAPVADGPCDSKTRGLRMCSGIMQKLPDNFPEFVVLAAWKNALRNQTKMTVLGLKICKPGIGPANIAGQNHFSKFLQRRPSRSSNSSASLGPHELLERDGRRWRNFEK